MPKPAKGELTWTAEGPVARITLKGRERQSFLLPTCKTEAQADAHILYKMNRLRSAFAARSPT